ncbi:hypothetical protein ACOME3_007631 [Neoechinorhynchus agilis]
MRINIVRDLQCKNRRPTDRFLSQILIDWSDCICQNQSIESCRRLISKCPSLTSPPTSRQWFHVSALCFICFKASTNSEIFNHPFDYLIGFVNRLSLHPTDCLNSPQPNLQYLVSALNSSTRRCNRYSEQLARSLMRLIVNLLDINASGPLCEIFKGLRDGDQNLFSKEKLNELSRRLVDAISREKVDEQFIKESMETIEWCGGAHRLHLVVPQILKKIKNNEIRFQILKHSLSLVSGDQKLQKLTCLLKKPQPITFVRQIFQLIGQNLERDQQSLLLPRYLIDLILHETNTLLVDLHENNFEDFVDIRSEVLDLLLRSKPMPWADLVIGFPDIRKCSDYILDNIACLICKLIEKKEMTDFAFLKLDELIAFSFEISCHRLTESIFMRLSHIALTETGSDRICRSITCNLSTAIEQRQSQTILGSIAAILKGGIEIPPGNALLLFTHMFETLIFLLPAIDQKDEQRFIQLLDHLVRYIGNISSQHDGLFDLFRNFWTFISIQFHVEGKREANRSQFESLALFSPVIIKNGEHLRNLEFNPLMNHLLKDIDVYSVRGIIMQTIAQTSTDARSAIEKMSSAKLFFLNAVYFLETLRITAEKKNALSGQGKDLEDKRQGPPSVEVDDSQTDITPSNRFQYSIEKIFKYLEEPYIQTDKTNMFVCIEQVAWHCFAIMLSSFTKREDNCRLMFTVQFLLQKSCVQSSQVSKLSRQMLDQLLSHQHLLVRIWTYRFVCSMMNLIQALTASLGTDTGDTFVGVKMRKFLMAANKKTNIRIPAYEKFQDKRERLGFFVDLWTRMLTKHALPILPLTTRSHIQHFFFLTDINLATPTSKKQSIVGHDEAVALTIDVVTKFDRANATNTSHLPSTCSMDYLRLGAGINTCVVRAIAICLRTEAAQVAVESGLNDFDEIYNEPVDEKQTLLPVDELLYKISALLVYHEGVDFEHQTTLVDMVAYVPSRILTVESISAGIECWCWLLSARADLGILLIERVLRAWIFTVQARMGIFSSGDRAGGYDRSIIFAPFEQPICDNERPVSDFDDSQSFDGGKSCDVVDVEPHRLWLEFLDEQLDIALASNSSILRLFDALIVTSLPAKSEQVPCVAATVLHSGPFFQLLLMAIKLNVQHHSDALEERILLNALRYFSNCPRVPTRTPRLLTRDLNTMCAFFDQVMKQTTLGWECSQVRNRKSDWVYISAPSGYSPSKTNETIVSAVLEDHRTLGNYANLLVKKVKPALTSSDFKFPVESEYDNLPEAENPASIPSTASNFSLPFEAETWPCQYTRRDLLLALLAIEIRRISVHINPIDPQRLSPPIETWYDFYSRPDTFLRVLDVAWYVSPLLAVWTYSRVCGESVKTRLRELISTEPDYVLLTCPYAVWLVADGYTDSREWGFKQSYEHKVRFRRSEKRFYSLLPLWRSCNPIDALGYLFISGGRSALSPIDTQFTYGRTSADHRRFFSRNSQSLRNAGLATSTFQAPSQSTNSPLNPFLSQYACRSLSKCKPSSIFPYIPQLVQSIRFDSLGYAELLIVSLSRKSNLLAHQFIWNMMTNCFLNDSQPTPDLELKPRLDAIIQRIIAVFEQTSLLFYQRQFAFTSEIVGVSGKLRAFNKGIDRNRGCSEAIFKVHLPENGCCYLPCNPDSIIIAIKYESAKPMQSAEKAPYRCSFDVREAESYEDMERFAKDPHIYLEVGLIVKYGENKVDAYMPSIEFRKISPSP